jgi:hypothetical protein
MTQMVGHQLPTTAAQVQYQVRSCGICGEQSGIEVEFSQSTIGFLCQFSFNKQLHIH